jgi:hypothetical protein
MIYYAIAAFFLVPLVINIILMERAKPGYEDRTGFHQGYPPGQQQ